jgi:hypothetical protein
MIFVILCYFKVSLVIAFPCKFQGNGCHIYSELIHKTSHEALCSFRPVSCQYGIRGCTQILLYHLMEKHVLECRFKPPNLHAQLSSSSSRDNSLNWCKQRLKKKGFPFWQSMSWHEGQFRTLYCNPLTLHNTTQYITDTDTHQWHHFRYLSMFYSTKSFVLHYISLIWKYTVHPLRWNIFLFQWHEDDVI